MNVKELIEKLSELDQEAIIVTRGYEGGVTESTEVKEVEVALNVNTSDMCEYSGLPSTLSYV